mmetsp:Transcript_36600/g.93478  ORF Transcript_36600/g.93478 Transcript_36600/m.93478 type:complete len:86 (-) Transcript_36600:133-390(-)
MIRRGGMQKSRREGNTEGEKGRLTTGIDRGEGTEDAEEGEREEEEERRGNACAREREGCAHPRRDVPWCFRGNTRDLRGKLLVMI